MNTRETRVIQKNIDNLLREISAEKSKKKSDRNFERLADCLYRVQRMKSWLKN